jgi:hypothetical protein
MVGGGMAVVEEYEAEKEKMARESSVDASHET